MLPNLVQVQKRVLESLQDCGHSTQRSPLQLLALEQRLSIPASWVNTSSTVREYGWWVRLT